MITGGYSFRRFTVLQSGCDAYLRPMFRSFDFCLPTRSPVVPSGLDWFHEIKQDGYRIRLERDGERIRLITRGGYDSNRFPWIVEPEARVTNPTPPSDHIPIWRRCAFPQYIVLSIASLAVTSGDVSAHHVMSERAPATFAEGYFLDLDTRSSEPITLRF